MKRWAMLLALASVALCATPSRADEETSCEDTCSAGCANACSSVCKREATRESCEIRCNPACYGDCEPRCETPTCGEACASTCASRCSEPDAGDECASRCAAWCAGACPDESSFSIWFMLLPQHERQHHPGGSQSGWCPGQVPSAPPEHPSSGSSSEPSATTDVDPDAPGTVAACNLGAGDSNAPPLLALLGLTAAMGAWRRRVGRSAD